MFSEFPYKCPACGGRKHPNYPLCVECKIEVESHNIQERRALAWQ